MALHTLAADDTNALLAAFRAHDFGPDPRAVMYFADDRFDQDALAAAFAERFPAPVATFGAAGRYVLENGGIRDGAVRVVVFDDAMVDVAAVEAIENVTAQPDPQDALARLGDRLGVNMLHADPDRHAGLVLSDEAGYGLAVLLERLGDRTLLPFVGGSACDALRMENTWVSANGRVYRNASVVAVLRMKRRFLTGKTQSFRVLDDRTFIPVRAADDPRHFLTLNGQPAKRAYLDALGVQGEPTADEWAALSGRYLFGLVIADDVYCFAPHAGTPDGGLSMVSAPRADWPLHLFDWVDVVENEREALDRMRVKLGETPSVVVEFMCMLRYIQLESEGRMAEYAALYENTPWAGFTTHGEAYYASINATSTFLWVGSRELT